MLEQMETKQVQEVLAQTEKGRVLNILAAIDLELIAAGTAVLGVISESQSKLMYLIPVILAGVSHNIVERAIKKRDLIRRYQNELKRRT